jgi:hypothetical protein
MQLVRSSSQASDGVQIGFAPLARLALALIVAIAWAPSSLSPGRPRRAKQQRRAAPETERWTIARA